MQDFYIEVFEAPFLEVALDEVDHFGEHFVGVAGAVADVGNAKDGMLPLVEVADLCRRNVELVDSAGKERFHVLPLVFERVVLWEIESDAEGAYYHAVMGGLGGAKKKPLVGLRLIWGVVRWRHRADSNRWSSFCRALPCHLATVPHQHPII